MTKIPTYRVFDPIAESDIIILQNSYPSGVRDWVFCRENKDGSPDAINPIELLGLDRACEVLNKVCDKSQSQAVTFSLSRLLVQCLKYRNNTRHLVVEPWDETNLTGESFLKNRTDLARDCSVVQAERFKLVMAGQVEAEKSAEEQYWGAFSALPIVPDRFKDELLWEFAKQMLAKIEGNGVGNVTVNISSLKTRVERWWKDEFFDFELKFGGKELRPRDRRGIFKRLMSVAVRQSSTMTWQIAFDILAGVLGSEPTFSEQEKKLFEIRYGSYEPLGNINVGFLYGDGDLHADLLNALGKSLVIASVAGEYGKAEENLYRSVRLLGESRDWQKKILARKRKESRDRKQRKSPGRGKRKQAKYQADKKAKSPDSDALREEFLEGLRTIADSLKPKHSKRVKALIDSNGCRADAAKICGVSTKTFNRQYRQSTKAHVNKALAELGKENEIDY